MIKEFNCARVEVLEPRKLLHGSDDVIAHAPAAASLDAVQFDFAPIASSPVSRTQTNAATVKGRLYLLGGFEGTAANVSPRGDVYDPQTNQWRRIADMPQPITHAATVVDGNSIFLVGGFVGDDPGTATRDVWWYQTRADTWQRLTRLPKARGAGAAAIIGTRLYFAGGLTRFANGDAEVDHHATWSINLADINSGWSEHAPLPRARNHLGGVAHDGGFYAIGGQTLDDETGGFADVSRYNPRKNKWITLASLPQAQSHLAAGTLQHDGQIIVAGGAINGAPGAGILSYDPASDAWTRLPSLQAARKGAAVTIINGQIITATGGNPAATSDAFAAPFANQWWEGVDMPNSLGEVAGGVIGDKIYVVGDGSTNTLSYDLDTGEWKNNLAKRANPAKDHLSQVYNGRLYLFGGVIYSGGQQVLDKVQIYDPASNNWTLGATMPFATLAAQTALMKGEIYVAGGVTTGNTSTRKFAKYNPQTDQWTLLPDMPIARNSAATGTDGRYMWIFGGRGPGSGDGDSPGNGFADVMKYDVVTGKWKTSFDGKSGIKPLPQARGGIVSAPYLKGEFYVMGGETVNGAGATSNNVYNRVDIYNPTTNTWRRGPNMPTARHGITPFQHANRIFVAGGGTTSGKSESNVVEVLQS